jgi:hypothetical protein
MGLGDPGNNESGMVWEKMTNESMLTHSKYRFDLGGHHMARITPGQPGTGTVIARRGNCWQRTRATEDGVTGWAKLRPGNYKLVDEQSGEMIAVFLSTSASWGEGGNVEGQRWSRRAFGDFHCAECCFDY